MASATTRYARKNVRFFVLDSTQMDSKQVAWIETSLQQAREDWKICYFHHPLYSNAERHGASVDLRVLLEPIFVKHGVNVVFSGHDHVYERLKPQTGHLLLRVRSAGQLRKGNMSPTDQTAAYFDQDQSFMLVEIAGTELYFQAISRTGKRVDSGVIQKTVQTQPGRAEARQPMKDDPARRGLRHRVRTTVPRLSRFAVEHLLLLPLGALIALVWVNTAPESYYRFTFAISFAVNDIAMVLFFALMTKEVVEATAPGGVLHPWRRAMLPVVASIGATAVPALIHVRIVEVLDEPMLSIGWPVTLAIDLAIGYFVARIIFGPHHPVIPFLLLLGIASDALGFVSLALFNPTREVHFASGVLILAGAIGIAAALRSLRVRSFWPYLLGAGERLVVRVLLERPASGTRTGPDHAVPASRGTRSRVFRRCTPRRERYVESVRDVVEVPCPGRAVLFRTRQCRRANGRPRGGHLGTADCRHRRQAPRASHRRRPRHCSVVCTFRTASAGEN